MKIKFESILNSEVLKKKIVKFGLVARSNGKIEYISKKWKIKSTDIKQCIISWQSQAPSVTLEGTKYSCLRTEPDFFSAYNYKKKAYLVGAVSPDSSDQYFILGYAPPKSDGKNAYVDIVRAANRMKKTGAYLDSSTKLGKYSKNDIVKDVKSKKNKKKKKKKGKKEELGKIRENIIIDTPQVPNSNKNGSVLEKAAFISNALNNRGRTTSRPLSKGRVISNSAHSINSQNFSNQTNFRQKSQSYVGTDVYQEVNGFLQWLKDPNGFAAHIQLHLDNQNTDVIREISKAYRGFGRIFGF